MFLGAGCGDLAFAYAGQLILAPLSLTPRFREANCGTSTPLEVELELAAHGRTEAVEKLAESRAGDVILHLTGVEVVSGVKNGHADSRSSSSNPGDELWYGETFRNLHGERQKCWEASRLVAWADKIQALINEGEREARSNLDQGRDVDIVAHSQLAIGKESVRRVKGLWPVLVRPHYERWKIAEKVINRVKIAPSLGPHVSSVPRTDARVVIDCEQLQLAVARTAEVAEHKGALV